MSAGGTCSVGSSTSTTRPPRDRIGVSDPHELRVVFAGGLHPCVECGIVEPASEGTSPSCGGARTRRLARRAPAAAASCQPRAPAHRPLRTRLPQDSFDEVVGRGAASWRALVALRCLSGHVEADEGIDAQAGAVELAHLRIGHGASLGDGDLSRWLQDLNPIRALPRCEAGRPE